MEVRNARVACRRGEYVEAVSGIGVVGTDGVVEIGRVDVGYSGGGECDGIMYHDGGVGSEG